MRRDGERDSGHTTAPEHAEVTGLGNVDQQVAARRRGLGLQQRVDTDEPVLVEMVVGDDIGRNVQVGAIEIVEHDGRRRVRHQVGRGCRSDASGTA